MNRIAQIPRPAVADPKQAHAAAMLDYLRAAVLGGAQNIERFHAIFVDHRQAFLGDTSIGQGQADLLSLRMRDLFAKALSIGASGLLIAHNHPSGDCRPSQSDIVATKRLADIARALDIEILDHLIITHSAVYSMRAGGKL